MEKNEVTWEHVLIAFSIVLALGFSIGLLGRQIGIAEQRGYKRGQIDALNGKWKYEVVVNTDTTYIAKPE